MNKRASLTATEEQTDINISPLIDMVFILLIFFIVTTVFVEEPGVEVTGKGKVPPGQGAVTG